MSIPSTMIHPALADLLHERESIIADHTWRDRDSAGHLDALIRVSEAINQWSSDHRDVIDARLQHYLDQASFGKALAHLHSGGAAPHHP